MRTITLAFMLGFLCITATCNATTNTHLWKNRLLIIYANNIHNKDMQQQLSTEEANAAALNQLDLKVISATKKQVEAKSNYPLKQLFEHYNLLGNQFKLILIGKDGTVKFSATKYTPWPEIIKVIKTTAKPGS